MTTQKTQIIKNDGINMFVYIVPALSDNYMYLIGDKITKDAAVVDPVEPEKLLNLIEKEKLNLTTILTTHHHWDHSGGNSKLLGIEKKKLSVYGGDERIESVTDIVGHGHKFKVGSLNFDCLATPCHTTGHICYKFEDGKDTFVFTGDTLFLGGCGRFFEGTAEQMHHALNKVLAELPDETKVYCGHEYTIQNLEFGKHVEPENLDIKMKLSWSEEQRKNEVPTVPGTIGQEKKCNPFMRVSLESVQTFTNTLNDEIATMKVLRDKKNQY